MKHALNFINQIHDQLLHLLKPKNKQRVLVDLDQLSTNLWCTHFTDEFTRYSTVVIVRNKAVCYKAFIKHWISIFGATKKIFSPWRNGIFEQHNQTLIRIMLKVMGDTKRDCDTAFVWAVCAKNALINNNGFSPSQLVFSRNINLPNFINSQLPAQETTIKSLELALHISALHAAQKIF